jgi:predicted ATPase
MEDKIRIPITGGPSTGKTTLLEALAQRGFKVIPEIARIIIEEEMKKDSECLPWKNLYLFQQKVARLQLEQEHSYDGTHFLLDRGIVDGHGFSINGKIPTPELITEVGMQRYPLVLILDRLPFYKNDSARKETEQEAISIHRNLYRAYRETGHDPLTIPYFPDEDITRAVGKRADYITKVLEKWL